MDHYTLGVKKGVQDGPPDGDQLRCGRVGVCSAQAFEKNKCASPIGSICKKKGLGWNSPTTLSHRVHVWCIYPHLVDFYGKCRYIHHTWILWVWDITNLFYHQAFKRPLKITTQVTCSKVHTSLNNSFISHDGSMVMVYLYIYHEIQPQM